MFRSVRPLIHFCHAIFRQWITSPNGSPLLCVSESCWCVLPFCLRIQFISCWEAPELSVSQSETRHTRLRVRSRRVDSASITYHTHICVTFVFCFLFFFPGIRAYEQLGNRAFGPPGKMLAASIITVHNIGGIVMPFPPFGFFMSWHLHVKACVFNRIGLFSLPSSNVQLPLHRKVWAPTGHPGFPQ